MNRPPISRRAILKGVGASLLLPFLPSLSWAEDPQRPPAVPPRRLAILLFANGVHEAHWWAKEAGGGLELSDTLMPLAPFRDQLTVFDGLRIRDEFPPAGGGPHTPKFSNVLSGGLVRVSNTPDLAESIDQAIGRVVGEQTALPALTLGTEAPKAGLIGGVPSLYYSTVSWTGRHTPVLPEISPRLAFDSLFDVSGLAREKSVLDAVLAQARDVQRRLGAEDRAKLAQYEQAVRDLEVRIERASGPRPPGAWRPALSEPDLARPGDAPLAHPGEHMRLMLRIQALALRMDKTRVATFLFQNDTSQMTFEFVPGVTRRDMHAMSHHKRDPQTLKEYQLVNRFHTELAAEFLAGLAAVDEGGTSLFDSTMTLFGSNLMDGDQHDASHIPLVHVGGRACGIRGGRVLRYEKSDERLLCNLYLALAERMGAPMTAFGNSTMTLPGFA